MFTEFRDFATLRVLRVTKPAIGSWRWMTSKASFCIKAFILGLSQTDRDTRAIDPPLGIGTGRPIGMKSSSVIRCGAEQGAMTRTVWPTLLNSVARLLI